MEHAQWLEERRKGLGGSDAGAILGVSPYKTPYQVYLEKRGEADGPEDNEPMFWGRTLEPVIRQRYADITGKSVEVPTKILYHEKHPFMLANLDGITSDNRVLEIKTAKFPTGWGEPGTDEIPELYLCQVQHYMIVTGFEVADVAALIGGSDFRLYEIPADKELQEMMIEQEAAFWRMVENGVPPDPVSFSDVKIRFGSTSKASKIEASVDVLMALQRIKELKELSKEEDELKAIVMAHMGENDTLVDENGNVLATWKLGKPSNRFDSKSFKSAHINLYNEFCKEGAASRRFLIK